MLTWDWPTILYTCIVVFIGGVVQYEQSPTRWLPPHAAAVASFVPAMLVYVVHQNKHIEYVCFVDSLRYPIYPPDCTHYNYTPQPAVS
jgi:hypothetical protein